MAVDHHAVQRSLSNITLGVLRDYQRRRGATADSELQEGFQQFQIPLTGTAEQGITWVKKRLKFDFHFFEAGGQRDNPYAHPQFTYGFAVDPADDKSPVLPIIVSTAVEWLTDETAATTGCWLHIGVHSPTEEPRDFDGYLHVTFQGYGAPVDSSSGD